MRYAKNTNAYMEEIPKFYIYKGVTKMENEEIMMNEETSTEDMVPVEDNAIVDETESTVEDESSESSSAAGAVALVGMGVMAVVGTVHVVKTYVAPAVVKGVHAIKAKFSKDKVVEGEATETTEDVTEGVVEE